MSKEHREKIGMGQRLYARKRRWEKIQEEYNKEILALIKEETVRAQIDELGKAYPEMRRSIHGESNYYYDERIAQLQAELEEK